MVVSHTSLLQVTITLGGCVRHYDALVAARTPSQQFTVQPNRHSLTFLGSCQVYVRSNAGTQSQAQFKIIITMMMCCNYMEKLAGPQRGKAVFQGHTSCL